LKQTGLEWSTIIRLDNLTDGYVPLAMAGPNKCIAGYKSSGPKAGQVVFLPAPYDKACDEKLKQCLDQWFAIHNGEEPQSSALDTLTKELSSLLGDDLVTPAKAEAAPKAEEAKTEAKTEEPAGKSAEELLWDAPKPTAKEEAPAKEETPPPAAAETPAKEQAPPVKEEVPVAVKEEVSAPKDAVGEAEKLFEDKNNGASTDSSNEVPAKDLIRKMGQELGKPPAPEWCAKFSFAELDALRQELVGINEEMRLAQIQAQQLTARIEVMEDLKNTLLSAEGEFLVAGCTKVFEMLGWQVKPALGSEDELWLTDEGKTQAIVRLIYTTTQPNRSELASLAESVITYWGAHEVEPKGILVASTWADRPPSERKDEDFPESMNEFAKRKNLGLLTTAQLLSVYRDITVMGSSPKDIRELVLTTSGKVPGFTFEASKGKAAAAKS
jgi:hypothetical protein